MEPDPARSEKEIPVHRRCVCKIPPKKAMLVLVDFTVSILIVPSFIELVTINWSSWYRMTRPTVEGKRVVDHIEGFRMYLEIADGEMLQQVHAPELTPKLFERHFPYALVLDVENAWSEKFSKVLELSATAPGDSHGYHPDWYDGSDYDHLTTGIFTGELSNSMCTAASASSIAPGSSSGRSFGGGGGGC